MFKQFVTHTLVLHYYVFMIQNFIIYL